MSEGVMQGPAATATDFQRAQARSELECRILAVGAPAIGKTSLIVGRLERLVSAGLPAESIVSVTASADSAANQRAALATLCGNRVVGALRVDSLHGMAAGLVRRHWTRLGYPTEPAFVTPAIRAALLRDLFSDGEDHGWGLSPEIARQTAFLRTVLAALEGKKGVVGCGLDEERFEAFERRYRDELRQRGIFDRPSAFANATRLLIDGADDVRSIEHLLVDDVDHYRPAALEYLRVLGAGASSLVATASIDEAGPTGALRLAADLDCRPLVFVTEGSSDTAPLVSWTRRDTSIEELEAMTERLLALRRSGVMWNDISVIAMNDGIAERVATACRRADIPTAAELPHPWVTHLDELLQVLADGVVDSKAAEVLVAAVSSGLVDLDPGFGANVLRRALRQDDPIGYLAATARSERGEARRLVPVLDCFQRAKKAAAEGRDVATVAWMLWRGMPVAARLAGLRASSTTDRSMIIGARSVAAWHRELRAAVAVEPGLTVPQWHAAQKVMPVALAASAGRDGLRGSSVHIRRVNDVTSSVGSHLLIPLLGLADRTLPDAEIASLRRVVALSRSTVFVSRSGESDGCPSFLVDDPHSPVVEEKFAESDATVLLRAVGSSTTAIDDQIVIAAALDSINIDVPWATGGVSNGSITSMRTNAHPSLNGAALSRLNRCGLRVWFGEILGLGAVAQSSEEVLAAEVRAALREWSEKGDFSDEAGLRSLFETRVVAAVRPTLPSRSLLRPLRSRLATIANVVCRHTTLPIGEPIATGVDVVGELFGVNVDLTVDLLLSHPGGLELLQWQTGDGLVDRLAGEIDLNLAVSKFAEMFPQHEIAAGSVVDVVSGTTVPLTLGADATKRILLEGATRIASGDLLPHRSAECAKCPYRVLCPAHPQGRASW